MLKPLGILIAATVSLSATAYAGNTPPVASASQLEGRWEVISATVGNGRIQSLSNDDPSLMGKRLSITATRLFWDHVQNATDAPCEKPSIKPTRRDNDADARATVRKAGGPALSAFSVACESGSWGPNKAPSPTILAMPDGSIAIWWFDNGLLRLRRI
ncbi:hypothetical protein ACTACV_27335 [Pseudomonas syringae]|uniref:Lipocalin-like domain-containing protein n=1 Tax=Pseudomonas pergaminensis TaxID=2853159 RepID=A0ABD7TPZ6_9PSED|nr:MULTISPECIES: hypothetical protein [Pseudomonas]USW03716.1 hypothetical protein KUA23_13900 [Pseudomonas pergaminensis]